MSLASVRRTSIPELVNGDHLSRPEFERRYAAMPSDFHAELIEGVVYAMPSPVRASVHGQPHLTLGTWIGVYLASTPHVQGSTSPTVRMDMRNVPQPDLAVYLDAAKGGQTRIAADGYLENAPELVAEISASTISIDRNKKFDVYLRNGVREYVLWRTEDAAIDWFVMDDGEYALLPPDSAGVLRSRVFPGLWLDAAALLAGDLRTVIATVEQGIASDEHDEFPARITG